MKKTSLFVIMSLLIAIMLQPACSEQQEEYSGVPKIIFDNDMGNDIDDAFALVMLYNYVKQGKAELLGVTISKNNELAVPMVDVLNKHYGFGDLPIGFAYDGVSPLDRKYLRQVLELEKDGKIVFPSDRKLDKATIPEAYKLQRKILAEQPDRSVSFVVVGFSTNLKRLLESEADEYSDLNGVELVKKKVKLLSIMAGNFPNYEPEWNIAMDIPAAAYTFEHWPSDIVVCDKRMGRAVKLASAHMTNDYPDPMEHPLYVAYKYHTEDRMTPAAAWDLVSVLYAVNPSPELFHLSEKGRVKCVNDEFGTGHTIFTPDPEGNCRYMLVPVPDIKGIEEELVKAVSGRDELSQPVKDEILAHQKKVLNLN